jgi:hypothetical protein
MKVYFATLRQLALLLTLSVKGGEGETGRLGEGETGRLGE